MKKINKWVKSLCFLSILLAVVLLILAAGITSCAVGGLGGTSYESAQQVVDAGSGEVIPANGIYVQAGHTLTLSWSADSNLTGYIFTATQYNNWQGSMHIYVTSEASGLGSQSSISASIQNSDTYYAVLYNDTIVFGPSVEAYQFAYTVH